MNNKCKSFKVMAAQGELLLIRIDKVPSNTIRAKVEGKKYIVGHSETMHHHVIDADRAVMYDTTDPLLSYIEVPSLAGVNLIHERDFDTHEPLHLDKGIYEVRRQRESRPDGWARVSD